jgi:hypothetical protein
VACTFRDLTHERITGIELVASFALQTLVRSAANVRILPKVSFTANAAFEKRSLTSLAARSGLSAEQTLAFLFGVDLVCNRGESRQ